MSKKINGFTGSRLTVRKSADLASVAQASLHGVQTNAHEHTEHRGKEGLACRDLRPQTAVRAILEIARHSGRGVLGGFPRMSVVATPVSTSQPNAEHVLRLAGELNVKVFQVAATAQLLAEGATVPFIARYR